MLGLRTTGLTEAPHGFMCHPLSQMCLSKLSLTMARWYPPPTSTTRPQGRRRVKLTKAACRGVRSPDLPYLPAQRSSTHATTFRTTLADCDHRRLKS